jgi:hypothetical protein
MPVETKPKELSVPAVIAALLASGTGSDKLTAMRECATVDDMFDIPLRDWETLSPQTRGELASNFFDQKWEGSLWKVWRMMNGLPLNVAAQKRSFPMAGQSGGLAEIATANRPEFKQSLAAFRVWKMDRDADKMKAEAKRAAEVGAA